MGTKFFETLERASTRHQLALTKTLENQRDSIAKGAELFIGTLLNAPGTIFWCGNGGSAASSQHFAAELVGRYVKERGPMRGIALTTDSSILTAIGNDYGFDFVFSRQLEALARSGDLLVALTTSGSSKNVLGAVSAAKRLGMKSIVLTGQKGVHLEEVADVCIAVSSEETARIQEVHDFILHSWCEYLDANLTEK